MNERNAWDRFWGSGRIEDYLLYTESADGAARAEATAGMEGAMSAEGAARAESPAGTGVPQLNAADMVAMNNAVELSGIGGVDTFGLNNMAAMARQEELNGLARVQEPHGFAE